jgi:regulator of protease activity HflC (stomatin/prohibitin superfamily)
MHQHHDQHQHRDLDVVEEPLDAANQSLADALRASFGILKGIMAVLVVLYLFSNVRSIGGHEQALHLRFGRLLPRVHEAGLIWAFPFPIDEIVPLPTKKSNDLKVDSHTFHRRENEVGKALSFISRGDREGLNPSLDGALLTADAGLVHTKWKVTYKIADVRSYVSQMAGRKIEGAETLIRTLVETIGIQVASELTAEEVIRTRVDYAQGEMNRRIQARLDELKSGIVVANVEMDEPIPPIQVRLAFDQTQRAENAKQKKIRDAEQEQEKILSEAAGAGYRRLIRLLDELQESDSEELRAELDRMLRHEVEGRAGELIKDAGAYLSVVVGRMRSDVEEYRALVPEYERNASLLIERLWEQTRQKVFDNPGVVKLYRPSGLLEFRVTIPVDPEQTRFDEEQRLQDQKFDASKLRPERYVPVGPEYD